MLKTILSLLAIICFSFYANAQFNKKSILLSGNLSYSSTTTSQTGFPDQYTHAGNFGISIGKSVKENAVFGINFHYSPSSSNYFPNGYENIISTNNLGIGLFYRAYKSLGKEFYLFGQAGGNYFHQTNKSEYTGTTTKYSSGGGNLYLMPGISYKISKKFFLDLSIPDIFIMEYSSANPITPYPYSTSKSFQVSTSLNSNPLTSLSLGFTLNL